MPFVRSAQLTQLDSLTAEVHELLQRPTTQPGVEVRLSESLAARLEEQVLSRSAEELLEGRRRERVIAPEVLAFRVG